VASSGPLSPGTLANDAAYGSLAWANPSNAASSNDSRATVTITNVNDISNYLKATNFGFSIPAGATIDGIVVEFEQGSSSNGRILDSRVRIVKGGTVGSTDKSNGTGWPATDTYRTYGSSSDLWGETWTSTDINASTFGVVISCTNTTTSGVEARVDHIRITVHYTEASSGFTGWGVSMN
jgi:hypothetical protein